MNYREYWLNRGKDGPKHDSFVCVGVGDREYSLTEQLNIYDNYLYCDQLTSLRLEPNFHGYDDRRLYYITEEKFNELFPEDLNKPMNEQASETSISLPFSFFKKVIDVLQIGFENTEEVFVLNGQRITRSDKMNEARLENEMLAISNIITELKTFL